jgi:N-acetylglucosaminyldiphosphoundecaprenol N-acetyl-beta-D-mannosaminyltransferase
MGESNRMRTHPPRVDVVGTGISAATLDDVVEQILAPPPEGLMVAVSNVHAVMTARRDPRLAQALSDADIATTDGMPLAWALRAMGHPDQPRVHGFSVTSAVIQAGIDRGTRHFFYGSTPQTLFAMRGHLEQEYPGIRIAGMFSPPFGPMDPAEEELVLADLRASGANVVWVGLGMPKQELWMHKVREDLPGVSMVGIGAVFDWLAGNVSKAPDWMQNAGLEWLYRLGKEPRRLWRRYAWNNPAYMALLSRQVAAYRWTNRSREGQVS